jgi:uncharacterized glyoxalase superfamily protein PhnB
MSSMARRSSVAPSGWHTVTPRIVAKNVEPLLEFLRFVFDASGEARDAGPAEMRIGDSLVMVSDAGVRKPVGAFLYVYVGNVDATYRRALDAGARSIEEPAAMPYGDRRAMIEDGWGNTWQIATRLRTRSPARKSQPTALRTQGRPSTKRVRSAPRRARRRG